MATPSERVSVGELRPRPMTARPPLPMFKRSSYATSMASVRDTWGIRSPFAEIKDRAPSPSPSLGSLSSYSPPHSPQGSPPPSPPTPSSPSLSSAAAAPPPLDLGPQADATSAQAASKKRKPKTKAEPKPKAPRTPKKSKSSQAMHEVERILGERRMGRGWQYFVVQKGLNTGKWVKYSDIADDYSLLMAAWENHKFDCELCVHPPKAKTLLCPAAPVAE